MLNPRDDLHVTPHWVIDINGCIPALCCVGYIQYEFNFKFKIIVFSWIILKSQISIKIGRGTRQMLTKKLKWNFQCLDFDKSENLQQKLFFMPPTSGQLFYFVKQIIALFEIQI